MPSSERKKISVITTTFNLIKGGRKDVFIEMFKSVHGQTYPNIEHLIIDGGSKDGTIEFINEVNQEYGKKQLVIFSEPDEGITDATNKGFNKSTGDYVILMPSDDYYMRNDALELLANAIEKENVDFSCSDGWWLFKDRWRADLNSFTYRHPFMINTMLAKRGLFEKYGYFDSELKLVADYDLMFRILIQPDVKGTVVNEMLTVLRPGGASQQKGNLFVKETCAIYKKYFSPKCRLKNNECKILHYQYPSDKLFEKIYKNENNERILVSVKRLESFKDRVFYKSKSRLRKIILNLIFLHFIFRPIKRFLGIKKRNKNNKSDSLSHLHLGTVTINEENEKNLEKKHTKC